MNMVQVQMFLIVAALGCVIILLIRALHRIETLRARVRELEAANGWAPFDEREGFWGQSAELSRYP